jgi:hypothetical protein
VQSFTVGNCAVNWSQFKFLADFIFELGTFHFVPFDLELVLGEV